MGIRRRILVVAPHPDDEVLGVGGTMCRFAAEGGEVAVVIATRGGPPLFSESSVQQVRLEAEAAHRILGVRKTYFLELPAAALQSVPHSEVNAALAKVYAEVRPDILFVPFLGDIHLDHQLLFTSALVVARPNGGHTPQAIYAYETLSETNWNAPYLTPGFLPNMFVDVGDYLERKLNAFSCYRTQIRQVPHERSLESLRALSVLRGSTVGCRAGEAFVLVRGIM